MNYDKTIDSITESWSDDDFENLIEEMAYDDNLDRDEYFRLYMKAIRKHQKMFGVLK